MAKGLSFSVFGFPVAIHGSFVLVLGLLGWTWFSGDLTRVAAFVIVAVIAVLVHELGHAFAARSQGTSAGPAISLEGMAGLTRYRPAAQPSRLQSMFVSFAGPLAGILLGVVVVVVLRADLIERTAFTDDVFDIALFTTFGWSAFNLLPIVPLDGGHIMAELLPGAPAVRSRRAAMVSIALAVGFGLLLWVQGLQFAAILLAMMAFQNMTIVSASREVETPVLSAPPAPAPTPNEP